VRADSQANHVQVLCSHVRSTAPYAACQQLWSQHSSRTRLPAGGLVGASGCSRTLELRQHSQGPHTAQPHAHQATVSAASTIKRCVSVCCYTPAHQATVLRYVPQAWEGARQPKRQHHPVVQLQQEVPSCIRVPAYTSGTQTVATKQPRAGPNTYHQVIVNPEHIPLCLEAPLLLPSAAAHLVCSQSFVFATVMKCRAQIVRAPKVREVTTSNSGGLAQL
jgi:hypothetical protein